MKLYALNLLEAFSQLVNTLHFGNPNQTFSARLAKHRIDPDPRVFLHRYFWVWISFFERFFPGHLDWAAGPD